MIDGNPVVSEFMEDEKPVIAWSNSVEWKACHVRQWQYFLQVAKCSDKKCCSSFQSSYLEVVPERFLSVPVPVANTLNGNEWAKYYKDATYLSLHQNTSLRSTLIPNQATKKHPYIRLFLSICETRCDQTTHMFRLQLVLLDHINKKKSLYKDSCMVIDGCTESKTECVRPLHIAVRQQGELLCRMTFQEMKWVSIGQRDTENFHLENWLMFEMKSLLQSLILIKLLQSGRMKLRTEYNDIHCVKSVQVGSFFWSEYGKIGTRKNPVFGDFLCNDCFKKFLNINLRASLC